MKNLKNNPVSVNIAMAFIFLTALTWVAFGIIVLGNFHPAFPVEPLLRWRLGITAIAGGLVMAILGYLLLKNKRLAYWVVLGGLAMMSLVNLLDDVGWVDVMVALISLLPFILLIKDWHWYLQRQV